MARTTTPRPSVPTLDMVAAAAGVSRATASRVLNGSSQVTPEAITAVTAAVKKLNYVPNRVARNLARRSTQMIAVVIPEHTAAFFADPYFASVIQGAALYLSSTDYSLTLLIASEANPEKTQRFLLGGNVDGALIMSHHSGDRFYLELANTLPVVFAGRPMGVTPDEFYVIDIDNVAVAREATEYLLARGRRTIATVGGPQTITAGIDRVTGWRDALTDAGLPATSIETADFDEAGGRDATRRLLARGDSFDAIFVASAQMAAGVLEVLRDTGLRVPEDVAITTVDNDYYARTANPTLTTMDQHTVAKGQAIAETLVRIVRGEKVPKFTKLPTTLIERNSA